VWEDKLAGFEVFDSMVCAARAGKEYSIGEVIEAGDFKRCAAMALKALEHDKDCGQPKVGHVEREVAHAVPQAFRLPCT
jgi:hypothetical protein